MNLRSWSNAVLLLILSVSCRSTRMPATPGQPTDSAWNAAFETKIETLRLRYHIPGLSAGVLYQGKLVWKKGFGYADVDQQVVPDEHTVYQIASLSKTFGSIILMQQVEAGKISLDDPIRKYGIDLGARWSSDTSIKIKHLLTHTAMGTTWNGFKPGYSFRYNGDWYGQLGKAIEKASGQTYGELLVTHIIRPLQLQYTAPSLNDSLDFALTGYDRASFAARVAKPYDWQHGHLVPIRRFKYGFSPAAGIMSCVSDLALYSNAIDRGDFIDSATWKKVFTPFVSPNGKVFQYGLGWFVTYYKGVKLVWHTGWWTGYSALLVKIPEKHLTFIILANSQDLSRPFYHIAQPIPGFGFYKPFHRNLNNNLLASDFGKAFVQQVAGL